MPSKYKSIRESILTTQPSLYPDLDAALWKRHGFKSKGPNEEEADELRLRCAQDPEFYIFGGFVRTFDERDRKVKPFPDKAYLRAILADMHQGHDRDGDVAAFSKSRQLLFTWTACAYSTWDARSNPFGRVMIQTKKAEDAWNLVYRGDWMASRCGFIERAMPVPLRAVGLAATRGLLSYPNGSTIWGIPQGAHQLRSYAASLVIMDECCFWEKFEEAYTAALAMAKRIVLITTAAHGAYYGDLVEENEAVETSEAVAA